MARTESLNILLTTTGKDYLAEQYGAVIANVQKRCISSQLKNNQLGGNPEAGSVEVKRFENKASKAYGTARAAGKGDAVVAKPIVLNINQNKEIVAEVEDKSSAKLRTPGAPWCASWSARSSPRPQAQVSRSPLRRRPPTVPWKS